MHNFGHGAASDMRVSKPHLVEKLARAALKNVKGSDAVLSKHFQKGFSPVSHPLKPPRIKPQKMYDGYGTH